MRAGGVWEVDAQGRKGEGLATGVVRHGDIEGGGCYIGR